MKAVTTGQIRELDQRTIAAGTPGEELMERAGYAVARSTIQFLKRQDSRSVLLTESALVSVSEKASE